MENRTYNYGTKIAGIIIHQFFTILLVITLLMLGTMLGKNMLSTTDIGEASFVNSGYYVSCLGKKYEKLNEYLYLEQSHEDLQEEEERRYLEYTNEFQKDKTNFTYWCEVNGILYTNDPEYKDKTEFDKDKLLDAVRKDGDYLIYDVENLEFETNIGGIEKYFFRQYNANYMLKSQESLMVISVDTDFPYQDDLSEAKAEYQQLHPWVKAIVISGILSAICWVVSLVYLTLAAGRKEGTDEIVLNVVDRVKTEIMFLIFLAVSYEIISLCMKLGNNSWNISGLAVAAGTISWVADTVFLIFYLSMVRRLKAETLWENSLALFLKNGFEKTFRERKVTTRVLIGFGAHFIICAVLVYGFAAWKKKWCLALLLLFCAGECYMMLRKAVEHYQILQGVRKISAGALEYKIDVEELHGEDRVLGEAINNIGEGLHHAVDDSTKNERMKADLITNVSHDIKTPLTSIINYVNLMKREDIQNERVNEYIRILDEKSMRLKQLTEDLVEASKISSGNVKLDFHIIDFVELIYQTGGEFNEKFETKDLTIVTKLPKEAVLVYADGRQLYRVIENLYNNVAKYALPETRVYVELVVDGENAVFSIKNVSERSLARENAAVEDLTERFIRGDESRTTEGSGLGLSIAKNLTQLMKGQFLIGVDGDLFKATIIFPLCNR